MYDLKYKETGNNFPGYIGSGNQFSQNLINSVLLFDPNNSADQDGILKNGAPPLNQIKRTAAMMPFVVELFYIRRCSVLNAAGICNAVSDGGTPQPTLVRRRLMSDGTMADEPVVDGCSKYANATDITAWTGCAGTPASTADRWQRVISARINLLARASELEVSLNDQGPYNLSTDTPAYNPFSRVALYPNNHRFRRVLRTINTQPRNASRPYPKI
jgi:hypothetical protein